MHIPRLFLFKILTACILLIASIWLIFLPLRYEVLHPRLGQPLILQPGQSFEITVKTSVPYWPSEWQAELQSTDKKISLSITNIENEFAIHTLQLKLPSTIDDNKYTLILSNGEQQVQNTNAIYINAQPKDSIKIIQMADLPTLSASGTEAGDLQLKKIIQETNLINPDLVLFTGDLAYQGSWAQYYQLLAAMQQLNAPVIAAPGNHEYQGWSAFLTLLGQPYHVTEYGHYLIISINSGHARDQLTYSQLAWLKQQLLQHADKTIIVQLHHSIHHRKNDRGYLQNNVAPLLSLLKEYSVPIVLSGHWHGDSVFDERGQLRNDTWQFAGTVFAVTTAAGAKLRQQYSHSPLHHGYRLIRFENRKIKNFTYDYDGDGTRDPSSSLPYNHLSISYANPFTAKIDNRLNESLNNIMVTFRIADTSKQYSVHNARLFKKYIKNNTQIIQVITNINANSLTTIQLKEIKE